jgi:hypothetical protein
VQIEWDGLIVKPCLWDEYGVTPQYAIDAITRLRDVIGNTIGKKIKPDVDIMKQVRSHYLGKTIDHFDKLWQGTGIDFNAKTHAWRKLYGAHSHLLYNKGGALNAWLMMVLGHMGPATSLSYANVVVVTYPVVTDKNVTLEIAELRSKIESELKEIKSEIEKKSNYNPDNNVERANLVSLPAEQEAENILVPYINMPRKRFKPDQQEAKKAYLDEWTSKIEEALAGVDIGKLRDTDWKRIGVTQELGRALSQRYRE